jgi:lactate 2-monooxygenase
MATPTIPTSYGSYQSTLYGAGILHSRLPIVTTDPNKLEEQAKSKLPLRSYNYVAGGAGERATMDANRLAFRTWKLVPKLLWGVGVGEWRGMGVELWGVRYGELKGGFLVLVLILILILCSGLRGKEGGRESEED